MSTAYKEIGIFEAKTKLSELLRSVREERQNYTITVRGEAVADLVPSMAARERKAEESIEAMLSIKQVEGISPKEVKSWIEKGRK